MTTRTTWLWRQILVTLVWGGLGMSAHAQERAEPGPLQRLGRAVPGQGPLAAPTTARGHFVASGASPRGALAVAEDPARPGGSLALLDDGSVLRSTDAGGTWSQVRTGRVRLRMGDDGLQLEADALAARQMELVESLVDDAGEDPEALQEAIDEGLERLAAEWGLDASGGAMREAPGADPVGLWFVGEGVVVSLPHDEGVWWSADGGTSWGPLPLPPAHDIERLRDGRWLVACEQGIFTMDADFGAWSGPLPGTRARTAVDLQAWGAGAFAASPDGLLFSPDGVGWHVVWSRGPVYALTVAADTQRIWFGTGQRVWWMTDPRGGAQAAVGPSLGAVLDVEVLPSGEVVAATSAGVVRSADAGVSFVPMTHGLSGQQVRQLRWMEGSLWAATERGLWRWEPTDIHGVDVHPADDDLPAGLLAEASIDGFPSEAGPGGGARVKAWGALLPAVHLQGAWWREDVRLARIDNGLDLQVDGYAYVGLQLEWTPRAGVRAVDPEGRGGDPTAGAIEAVYLAPDALEGASWSAVGRDAWEHRVRRMHQISGLVAFRRHLVAELAQLGRAPLRRRLDVMLRIEETEAWLDLLTGGALSAWRAGRHEEGG